MGKIRISFGELILLAELEDTSTTREILSCLPHESTVNRWGEEVYFSLPCSVALEKSATDVVDPGTVCFWVEGQCMAIPYGPTPASVSDECRLVTRVNILGKLIGDARALEGVSAGSRVLVETAE